MDIQVVLNELRQQRTQLDAAISAFELLTGDTRPTKYRGKGVRHMDADARARISKAMKAQWVVRKAAAKKSSKPSKPAKRGPYKKKPRLGRKPGFKVSEETKQKLREAAKRRQAA